MVVDNSKSKFIEDWSDNSWTQKKYIYVQRMSVDRAKQREIGGENTFIIYCANSLKQ